MRQIIKRCMMLVCAAVLFCTVTACGREQDRTLTEAGVLGDVGLDSLMFSLDGVIYTLPVHFSELEANGWQPYDSDNSFATDMLEPGDYDMWELVYDNQNVLVFITNLSEEVLPVGDSYVTAVAVLVHERAITPFNADLIVPGNIAIGSTLEDVLAAYGDTATWMSESDDGSTLAIIHSTDYYTFTVNIDTVNNVVTHIFYSYWRYLWV